MLWISVCEVVSISMIGGIVGGCLMSITSRNGHKYNMSMIESYWDTDVKHLKSMIEVLENKISTISVDKHVIKVEGHRAGKSYKNQRHSNQRG